VPSDFAGDMQTDRIVTQDVVAQAEDQDRFLPARRQPGYFTRR
jgi:hypothetical protein